MHRLAAELVAGRRWDVVFNIAEGVRGYGSEGQVPSLLEVYDILYTFSEGIMGWLPGFSTPRIVCDVPFVGKCLVHRMIDYDRTRGISYRTKNYRTPLEFDDPEALIRRYEYYDPIHTLPEKGNAWWA